MEPGATYITGLPRPGPLTGLARRTETGAPVWIGDARLFSWLDPQVAAEPLVAAKAPLLNVPFFILRVAVYFAVWIFFARLFGGLSQVPVAGNRRLFQREPDREGGHLPVRLTDPRTQPV